MGRFPTTRWSAIRGLGSTEEGDRRRSWDAVTAAYWRPVYKYLRVRWRKTPADAEDLTQGFFERALEQFFLEDYDPAKARFRTFVRLCLDRYVSNADKAARRQKRGGGMLACDFEGAEAELAAAAEPSPDELFDREWQRAIFSRAIDELRAEYESSGRQADFSIFERYDLCVDGDRPTYETLAREHDVPVTTVTNRLARARRDLRRLVLEALAEITGDDREHGDEARRLLGAGA